MCKRQRSRWGGVARLNRNESACVESKESHGCDGQARHCRLRRSHRLRRPSRRWVRRRPRLGLRDRASDRSNGLDRSSRSTRRVEVAGAVRRATTRARSRVVAPVGSSSHRRCDSARALVLGLSAGPTRADRATSARPSKRPLETRRLSEPKVGDARVSPRSARSPHGRCGPSTRRSFEADRARWFRALVRSALRASLGRARSGFGVASAHLFGGVSAHSSKGW
jgi:hypothetical protein